MKFTKSLTFFFFLLFSFLGQAVWAAETPKVDTGTTACMLISTGLVLFMIPGLAMFYGGLVRTKNVLGTMMHSFIAMAVIGVLWAVCGYSLAFGKNILGGWIGWNGNYFFLNGIDDTIHSAGVPEYVVAMFQGKFAIITPAIIAGAFAERVRFWSYTLFITFWFLLVYCPLCHWVWSEDGFLFRIGARGLIDLAGGTVIHVSAGVSALVAALYLGARHGYPKTAVQPNNLVMTLTGAGLLWVGWFGFNAGSTVSSGLDTARALTMTQLSAAAGSLTWVLIEGSHLKKTTSLGFATGILAGLVAITPAAGVVQPVGAITLGALSAMACYCAILLKYKLGYDDTLDVFGVHGVGSGLGVLLLSFFIRPSWMTEAAQKAGGIWTVWNQFGIQALGVGVALAYAGALTFLLLFIINKIIGFRLEQGDELAGMDESLHGEEGYGFLR
ncbi:MAG: ammonium transporter [Deltaproteobacteria bacterium]|nr:ammonium transporter [Deltaproteobacteria bacterium]